MSIEIKHQMYKDLGSILSNELTEVGFKINSNYPLNIESQPGASDAGGYDYYHAWNIAYQYFSVMHRVISPAPRRVFWSRELMEKQKSGKITADQITAINIISSTSLAGESLVRFMSTRVEFSDSEDKLYSEWKIVHLHLDPNLSEKTSHQTELVHFTGRTGPILFAYFDQDGLYLLDILPHGKAHPTVWSNRDLVEILHKNWPNIIARYQMRNARLAANPQDSVATTEEIAEARKKGLSVMMVMQDGTTYFPFGGGMSNAGGNIQIVGRADALFNRCKSFLEEIKREANRLVDTLERAYGVKLSKLQLTLTLDDKNNPVFIDLNLNPPLRLTQTTAKPEGAIELLTPGASHSNSEVPLRWPTWAQDAA